MFSSKAFWMKNCLCFQKCSCSLTLFSRSRFVRVWQSCFDSNGFFSMMAYPEKVQSSSQYNQYKMHYQREFTCKRDVPFLLIFNVKSVVISGKFRENVCCRYVLIFISFIFMQLNSSVLPFLKSMYVTYTLRFYYRKLHTTCFILLVLCTCNYFTSQIMFMFVVMTKLV